MAGIDVTVGARIAKERRRKGWLQKDLAERIGRSESWVSQVERGVVALDSVSLTERIAGVLGVSVARLLAFDVRYGEAESLRPSPRGRLPSVPSPRAAAPVAEHSETALRRTFTLGSLAGLSAAVVGLSPGARAQVEGEGGAVDRATVAELRSIGAAYRRSYRSFPASTLVPVAHHQMQLVTSLRPKSQPAAVRDSLLAHMAEMAALASALLSLDLGEHDRAEVYMDLGYQIAKEIGSDELCALILAGRAFQTSYGGDPAGGLDCARAAVDVAARGGSVRMRAWTNAVASEMYCFTGDVTGFRSALEATRRLLSGPEDDPDWGGIGAFDLAKADAYEGSDLVRLGRFEEALPALDQAIDRLAPDLLRHRGTAFVSRAEAHAGAGNVEQACADGHAALDVVARVQHRDTLRRVTELHRGLRGRNTPAARSLAEHLLDTGSLLRAAGRMA